MVTFFINFLVFYWVFSFGVLFTCYILFNQNEHDFTIGDIVLGFITLLFGGGFLFPYFLGLLIVKIVNFLENDK